MSVADWGYAGEPRGWYERNGHVVYGRYVGDAPKMFWSVAFLESAAAAPEEACVTESDPRALTEWDMGNLGS